MISGIFLMFLDEFWRVFDEITDKMHENTTIELAEKTPKNGQNWPKTTLENALNFSRNNVKKMISVL